MNNSYDQYKKNACRYCDTKLDEPFLDLGLSPLANNLPKADEQDAEEFKCPLALTKCPKCHLVQLSHVVPADLMFAHYLYVSSTTKTFQIHFAEYAKDLKTRLLGISNKSVIANPAKAQVKQSLSSGLLRRPAKDGTSRNDDQEVSIGGPGLTQPLAVDIGSNDGLLLSCYQKEGMRAVGIEPAKNLADVANQNGFTTINQYFGENAVKEIIQKHGHADIISANNVFAHIDDVQSVLKNVNTLLDEDGIFVIEFPYLLTMFEKMFFDMIYHEHLSYIAITPLDYFAKRFGLEIFDIKEVPSHGGSLRVFIKKKTGAFPVSKTVGKYLENEVGKGTNSEQAYLAFAGRVRKVKAEILRCIQKIKSEGKSIAGYGAPAKATTIVNYCSLDTSQIDYVVDDNPLKQNRLVPGTRIPIVSSDHLNQKPPDYLLIFAWNFAKEILAKLAPLKQKNIKFIVPLPKPEIVSES